MDDQRLKEAHAVGSIAGTVACLRAMVDAKTPPPTGGMGGQLAQGMFDLLDSESSNTPAMRKAAIKGYCDGIQALMMQHLAPGTHPPLISGDVEIPNTPEVLELLEQLARLRK